jgi:hypothetical protein
MSRSDSLYYLSVYVVGSRDEGCGKVTGESVMFSWHGTCGSVTDCITTRHGHWARDGHSIGYEGDSDCITYMFQGDFARADIGYMWKIGVGAAISFDQQLMCGEVDGGRR